MTDPPAHAATRLARALRTAERRLFQTVKSSWLWIKNERASHVSLPLSRRLAMWRRGFFAESALLYDVPRNDPREYISDYQHLVRCSRINAWQRIYDHKFGLRAFLLAMGLRQAETVAYLYGRRVILDPFLPTSRPVSLEGLLEHLSHDTATARYVIKPEADLRGEGVFLLERRNGALFRRRGREVEPFQLREFVEEMQAEQEAHRPVHPWLIERWVEQGEFWRGLYPESANTMRMLTLWLPDEPEPFVARAVQRIGAADTVPTDHWTGGGVCAPLDVATGTLGAGRMYPLRENGGSRASVSRHPETGARIEGEVVPDWTGIKETVVRAASGLPFNRMAGWDVLVDREGVPVILEANGNSGLSLLQAHGGLLADPRVRRFFEVYGVV